MDLLNCLKNRHSIREYTGEEVTDAELESIVQAAFEAPSGHNRRPVELICIRNKEMLVRLADAKVSASGMLAHASAAIVVAANTDLSDTWIEDCSAAMMCMSLRATDIHVGSCWIQIRLRESKQLQQQTEAGTPGSRISSDTYVRNLLAIPDPYRVEAILSLGKYSEAEAKMIARSFDPSKVHQSVFGNRKQ